MEARLDSLLGTGSQAWYICTKFKGVFVVICLADQVWSSFATLLGIVFRRRKGCWVDLSTGRS